jgi:protein SCO1/2
MRIRALIPFAGLAVLALIAVLVLSSRGVGGANQANSTVGYGPYLTASEIPQALANAPAPHFELADARGGTVSAAALRGKPYAITFLYVHCLTICPLIGAEIHTALADLGTKAAGMNVVAISVDPTGDTRSAVLQWLAQHQEPSNFHYLIGTKAQLEPVWTGYHVAPQIAGDPNSTHSALIWLVSRQGRLQALIDGGVVLNTRNLAHDFRVLEKQS